MAERHRSRSPSDEETKLQPRGGETRIHPGGSNGGGPGACLPAVSSASGSSASVRSAMGGSGHRSAHQQWGAGVSWQLWKSVLDTSPETPQNKTLPEKAFSGEGGRGRAFLASSLLPLQRGVGRPGDLVPSNTQKAAHRSRDQGLISLPGGGSVAL